MAETANNTAEEKSAIRSFIDGLKAVQMDAYHYIDNATGGPFTEISNRWMNLPNKQQELMNAHRENRLEILKQQFDSGEIDFSGVLRGVDQIESEIARHYRPLADIPASLEEAHSDLADFISFAVGGALFGTAAKPFLRLFDPAKKIVGMPAGAKFTQTTYSPDFGRDTIHAFESKFGMRIRTVDDLAAALRSGDVSPNDLTVTFVERNGNTLIYNTRTSQALTEAGIPRSQWNAYNGTGDLEFENGVTRNLNKPHNALTEEGVETVVRARTRDVLDYQTATGSPFRSIDDLHDFLFERSNGRLPSSSEELLEFLEEHYKNKPLYSDRPFCFAAGTPVDMADGSRKAIEQVVVGDSVLAYDPLQNNGQGALAPHSVTRTYATPDKLVLDFHGLKVTPGHVFLCGDGAYEGQHRMLIDILRDDGAVVGAEGRAVRAATNAPLGSREDAFIQVRYLPAGEGTAHREGRLRAGTLLLTDDGDTVSVLQRLAADGYSVTPNGLIARAGEEPQPLHWYGPLPRPEDYVLARSNLTDADLSGDLDYIPDVAQSRGSVLGSGWSPATGDGDAERGLFAGSPAAPKHGGETLH